MFVLNGIVKETFLFHVCAKWDCEVMFVLKWDYEGNICGELHLIQVENQVNSQNNIERS